MKLIVGLGNPGPEYHDTRHNVGFVVLDRLARRWAPGEVARSRFHAATLDARVEADGDDVRTLLLKPTTYMNRSGLAVSEAIRFYKLDPAEALLVIVDDVALECGTIRVRPGGGAGGHNGLDDIQRKLGTDQYARLRIGIDGPGAIPQKDYVLGKFRPDQLEAMGPALEEATEAATFWATRGCTDAMNRFNRRQSA
ncbi:MAG: aminoacyl-tRNA hydrolase [Planctomycetota bacterium]|jgi:PTH1 family peptidyl-tRNA hydrolase